MPKRQIIIDVQGGTITDINNMPENIEIVIKDYDSMETGYWKKDHAYKKNEGIDNIVWEYNII